MVANSTTRLARPEQKPATIKFICHPDLRSVRLVRSLLAEADRVLADGNLDISVDQEIRLFKTLHACGFLLQDASGIRRRVGFSADSLKALRERIADLLVNRNLGLVYSMLSLTKAAADDHEELVSAGMWTLYQAVIAFDPWRGFRFSTYACQAIVRGFRYVSRREIRRREVLDSFHQSTRGDDADADEEHVALLTDRLRVLLDANAAELTPSERFIIENRYFRPESERPLTLANIGKLIQLSRERVRQIQLHALEKLRRALSNDPVLRYVKFDV